MAISLSNPLPRTPQGTIGGVGLQPPKPKAPVLPQTPVSRPPMTVPSSPAGMNPGAQRPPVMAPPTPATPAGIGQPAAQPAAPAPVLPQVPYANVTSFGPGQDLRATQIAPGAAADRFGIAGQRFDQFAERTNPAFQGAMREATQRAAANGRLGSGMLTNTYGDLATQRTDSLDLARRSFLTDALDSSISDQAGYRNELRGERDYQGGMAQQGMDNALRQRLTEESLFGNDYNRWLQGISTLGGLGFGGNPSGALLGAAGQYGNQADGAFGSLGDLMAQYAFSRGQGG